MGRTYGKLSAIQVFKLSRKGRHGDGGGLYLQISEVGTKSWLFRYTLDGKAREMGLGPLDVVSLADARGKALECRKLLLEKIDPIDARREKRRAVALESAKAITFDECAKAYQDSHRAAWKNEKHALQWKTSLATHASPVIGHLSVQSVDTALVLKILEPIWWLKTESASRLRNRIELVLDWASARGYRTGANPARWRGHLDKLLPARARIQPTVHHPAMPVDELGAFLVRLRERKGIAALALEFLILTATRTGESIGARWDEFDLKQGVWTIPPERMKARKEHRVPLSQRCIDVLGEARAHSQGVFVFQGRGQGHISNMSLLVLLRRMECKVVSHGFRSTFRDWAAERTNFPREVVEAALAHRLKDKAEAAYFRSDLFLRRRRMMGVWATFCAESARAAGVVVPMSKVGACIGEDRDYTSSNMATGSWADPS